MATRLGSHVVRGRRSDNDQGLPPPPDATNAAMYHFQGTQDGTSRNRRPPRNFDFRAPRLKAFERPLLTAKHDSSENPTFPQNHAQDKYRQIDELSDSDEEVMDLSESDAEEQPSKKFRLEDDNADNEAAPSWSNPDPYTSLPPLEETSQKRKDVIKLIRKARISAGAIENDMSKAKDDNFIPLDFSVEAHIGGEEPLTSLRTTPKHALAGARSYETEDSHPPLGPAINNNAASHLGKRRREDDRKAPRVVRVRRGQYHTDGMILEAWQAAVEVYSTPWLQSDMHSSNDPPGVALHKEIIDFYEWIRPRDYEQAVREDVVRRLQRAFERLEPGGQLRAFGSFAAGLYLPVSDMDLVYLRRAFRGRSLNSAGQVVKPPLSVLQNFLHFIKSQGFARKGSVLAVFKAKVPIIKFVDDVSGLKIDLSFDNDTGVVANRTFLHWKTLFPAVPILVSIVKHFLMIRGLNDVASGGLGGFSIICLVTSLVQHFPETSAPPSLGAMLVEFFNVYGNLFNRHKIAIRLDPPSYLDKRTYLPFAYNNEPPGRLAIIDPNRPDNNISGGTHLIELIFKCFAQAHSALQKRLQDRENDPSNNSSLLQDLVGDNFTAYDAQREALRAIYSPTSDIRLPPPPPPPPTTAMPECPPPPLTPPAPGPQRWGRKDTLTRKASDSSQHTSSRKAEKKTQLQGSS